MNDALAIKDLRFAYASAGPRVLDITSLTLPAGSQCLLRGSSGCGKSTLLHAVAGLIEPDAGTVRVAGRDIHQLQGSARDRYRGQTLGMIFQTFNLLSGFTAIENTMMPMLFSQAIPPAQQRERASSLLTSLGITQHSTPVQSLSVGQQQRVAVARALACKPALVLADEPTASLDPANAAAAIAMIQAACRESNAALLCVSHDPALGDGFDRVLSFADLSTAAAGATGVA